MAGLGSLFSGFVAGATAGSKLAGAKDDREYRQLRNRLARQKASDAEDPEMQKLNKDILRGRAVRLNRGVDPMLSQSRALDVKIKQKHLDDMSAPPVAPAGPADTAGGSLGASPSAAGPQSDATDPEVQPSVDTADMAVDPNEDATQFAAKGGMIESRPKPRKQKAVKRYADGGAVEDDTGDEDVAGTDGGGGDEGDDEADNYDYQDSRGEHQAYSPQAGHDAALEGITHAAAATGHTSRSEGVATDFSAARRARGSTAYYSGAGAATTDEMAAVKKAIPGHEKMSESELNFAALSHIYSYYLDKNEPDKAKKAAASMVQHYRMASDRYAAIAKVAAEHGDINGALKNIMRAHANVPDGMDLKLTEEEGKIGYTFKDAQSGKVMQRGIAPPDEILKWATNGGIGSFDSLVAAAGGQRAAAKGKGAAGEGAGLKQSDKKTLTAEIDGAWTKIKGDNAPRNPDGTAKATSEDPPGAEDLKSNAFAIAADKRNGSMSPHDAIMATLKIAQPNMKDPYKAGFTMKSIDGGAHVKFDNGSQVFVPQQQFDRLALIRANRLKEITGAADKADTKKPEGPGVIEQMGTALDRFRAANKSERDARPAEEQAIRSHQEDLLSRRSMDRPQRAIQITD